MPNFNLIDRKLDKVFENESDPLNKVRAQFLVNALISSLFVLLGTLPTFYAHAYHLLFVRSIIVTIFQLSLIWVLLNTKHWKLVAHGACIVLAVLIWSNIFVQIQGVKIISLQWMLILIVMSYYLLGTRWGIFYSFISLLFMLFYFAIFGKDAMTLVSQEEVNSFVFITVFVYNFLLIIYLQFHFFKAFNNTIKQLNVKQVESELLNEKLTDAVVASEESSRAKTYFLSTISHELRTPLNGVIGMSNLLLLDNPRPDQAENLNMLKFSANNLLSLINDVLDINKIESGKIEIEHIPFKIHDLINNIYFGFKNKAKEKGLQFELQMPANLEKIAIIGDPTRLTQILSNLLENAIKFTAQGKVALYIKSIAKQDDAIKLSFHISDTGIGIPKEKHELVFESFSQASTSTTRKYGGTGLGLAIVKNLLALHQSKISVASELGVGTTFSFEIEYKVYDCRLDEKENIEIEADMDISRLRILVAEDNQMNTLLMKKLLAKWDITPDFAANGLEAVEYFKTNTYDLILMDIHMPFMDGYEATTVIRNDEDRHKSKVQIIALTASVALDVRQKIAEAGINDFISKPFNPEELRLKLEELSLKN